MMSSLVEHSSLRNVDYHAVFSGETSLAFSCSYTISRGRRPVFLSGTASVAHAQVVPCPPIRRMPAHCRSTKPCELRNGESKVVRIARNAVTRCAGAVLSRTRVGCSSQMGAWGNIRAHSGRNTRVRSGRRIPRRPLPDPRAHAINTCKRGNRVELILRVAGLERCAVRFCGEWYWERAQLQQLAVRTSPNAYTLGLTGSQTLFAGAGFPGKL